jgi:hypothetical protein
VSQACPICGCDRGEYEFSVPGGRVQRCTDCGLLSLRPEGAAPAPQAQPAAPVWPAALQDLERYHRGERRRLLVLGPGVGPLAASAVARGWGQAHTGLEGAEGPFDAALLLDALGLSADPVALLARVRGLLRADGTLLAAVPRLDSIQARFPWRPFSTFTSERGFYFDDQTLQKSLARAGFMEVELQAGRQVLALARPSEQRERPLLSILVPIYNEGATFPVLMDGLLKKELPGLDREILLIESNSTDGTRELAQGYAGVPGVRVLLEERPRGKGHAVRTGLAEARGDIVLIQDGDLEYDLNDYDQLLDPLVRCQSLVVLGSRHSGGWKIRHFTDQPFMAWALNLAHLFFAFLLNSACGSDLKDPFTMYKVFRRDCVHGLSFKANRFDFDWELVIKLLRKGYKPLEIPVNYSSRSFQQGKKVRFFRDPITWVWALIRFRLGPL